MQEINETTVFQKSYDLYRVLHETVKKYPKADRYSLGETTKEKTLELIEAITKAGYAKKEWKVSHIEQAIASLEIVKIFVRLGYDTKAIDQKRYIDLQDKVQEIGRMLGGWRKSA